MMNLRLALVRGVLSKSEEAVLINSYLSSGGETQSVLIDVQDNRPFIRRQGWFPEILIASTIQISDHAH